MFDILIYGHPTLRKKAAPLTVFDAALKTFSEEMFVSMKEADGVGLAAPQVNRSIQFAVIDANDGKEPPYYIINPQITWLSEETEDYEEGCLSIPDIRIKINRPIRASVRALDITGKEYFLDKVDGLLARALQHEIDHLNGILFVDRASSLKRQMVAGKLKKLVKEQEGK